jgi:FKBP-type peptidyl-prolyl cis-trans isomerase FkpA
MPPQNPLNPSVPQTSAQPVPAQQPAVAPPPPQPQLTPLPPTPPTPVVVAPAVTPQSLVVQPAPQVSAADVGLYIPPRPNTVPVSGVSNLGGGVEGVRIMESQVRPVQSAQPHRRHPILLSILWIFSVVLAGAAGSVLGLSVSGEPVTDSVTTQEERDKVQIKDLVVGSGAEAVPGSSVPILYIAYVGEVATSTVFDSSAAHANKPKVFTLGDQSPIVGLQLGVHGTREGGERLVGIPPSLAYGAEGVKSGDKVIIPGGSTLFFRIKLVDVSTPRAQ